MTNPNFGKKNCSCPKKLQLKRKEISFIRIEKSAFSW
jgi:hypothetical protein